jgi:transposase
VIDGMLHRVRIGVQRRDLPERFGPWKTVYEDHRLWSADARGEVPAEHQNETPRQSLVARLA